MTVSGYDQMALLSHHSARDLISVSLGMVSLGLFLLLRLSNVYGDPAPWSVQKYWVFTLFSVLNCTKYPPSLLFLLMTLGLMFLCLALLERRNLQAFGKPFILFGKEPLFFYVLHLPVLHGAALVATSLKGMPLDGLFSGSPASDARLLPSTQYGFELAAVYGFWLALLLLLYPLCDAFLKIKRRYPHLPWLQYL